MTDAEVYAGLYLRYLRSGGAYDCSADTVLAKEAAVIGAGFARLRLQVDLLGADLVPPGSETMLPDWEGAVRSIARGTLAQRQASVLLRLRNFATPTVPELKVALEAELGYQPVIREVGQSELVDSGLTRNVFMFAVLLDPWPSERVLARLDNILNPLKPAHTSYVLCHHYGFFTDDPGSLTDRDVLAE